ncbi:MAG: hypothetical protein H6962_11945 [Chromatiaceae bacterium]|nr:hypothetical protein [Chromatiaceae bacterium]
MQATTLPRLPIVLLWLLLAYGCGQIPERPSRPASDPDAVRAAELLAAGQYPAAAELYRRLAAGTATPDQRAGYLLAAAEGITRRK